MKASKTALGLDPALIAQIDWDLALKRIMTDVRSDFIYSPHLAAVYKFASEELKSRVKRSLANGAYFPSQPLSIEVPKSSFIKVFGSRRMGPSHSRSGSILLPEDRLIYQVLADQAAVEIDRRTDHTRSFSHKIDHANAEQMFEPTRACWGRLQESLKTHSGKKSNNYVIKLDVANCFGSLNQHLLVNLLTDIGYDPRLNNVLEPFLLRLTGDKSSRGIVQGIYPSDLFGNFYLSPIDRSLSDIGADSARYVDDIYIFVESVDAADAVLRQIVSVLRAYDLTLNEAKCKIIPKSMLITEEPDLESLFHRAIDEISPQLSERDFSEDYGFQFEWAEDEPDDEIDEEELELRATQELFDSLSTFTGHEEKIERFCLPLFAKAESDYAVEHVLRSFKSRPSMGQIYSAYLAHFVDTKEIYDFLLACLSDDTLHDWQVMWVLAALHRAKAHGDAAVKLCFDILRDANRHEALRAAAGIFVGRFGDHHRRVALTSAYSSVGSSYVQAAIFFSSFAFPAIERRNASFNWSGHTPLHELVAAAVKVLK